MPIAAHFTHDAPLLRFVYRDQKGQVTERDATPIAMVPMVKIIGLGLRAHCALRDAQRTFALDSIIAITALDKTPAPHWSVVKEAVAAPRRRIEDAYKFIAHTHLRPNPAWTGTQAQDLGLADGMAWRDAQGTVRFDPPSQWGAPAPQSHHAALAARAALNRTGKALMALCPEEATQAMLWHGRLGWRTGDGAWKPAPH